MKVKNLPPDPQDELYSSKTVEEKKALYMSMMHGLQSGIATMIALDQKYADKKDLRVGVDSALIQDSALAQLLMEKGIITEDEYWTRIIRLVGNDITNLRRRVALLWGVPIEKVNFA